MKIRAALAKQNLATAEMSAVSAESLPRYIETSALVAAVLENDTAARQSIRIPGQRVTSALTITEASRAILRARLQGRITQRQERAALLTLHRFAKRCYMLRVTDAIPARAARPFPAEPVRTLDAIHLATAEALSEVPALVTVITRDIRVRDNAIALGYIVE